MDQQQKQRTVPLWAVLAKKRSNKYGGVPDLPDEELADPEELERQVHREEFGPVLLLPGGPGEPEFFPGVDEQGDVDWGAFGTVDFDRMRPKKSETRHRLAELGARLKDTIIIMQVMEHRLPRFTRGQVLWHVKRGVLDIGDIADMDLYQFVVLGRRADRLRAEIAELQERSRERERRIAAVMVA